jgi:hypothetical protein
VPDLLHQPRLHCTAFRFLDLLLELREMVYGIVFEKTHDPQNCDCEYENGQHTCNLSQVSVLRTDDHYDRRRIGNPTLLHVSCQVRAEAGKLYYRSKQLHMQVDLYILDDAEQEVRKWLQTVVGEFATHLRHFVLHLEYTPDSSNGLDFARIWVQYCPDHALNVTGSVDMYNEDEDPFSKNSPLPFVGMPSYVAALEKIRVKYKEQGKIIVEFFEDWEALRQACSDPDEKLSWLGIDEYGRRCGTPHKVVMEFGGERVKHCNSDSTNQNGVR